MDIFRQAGLPDGCLNLIFHRPKDASTITGAIIAHPAVKKINFTGSAAVGSIVAALAGKYLKPIITELGGKASLIVLQDADIQKAAEACTVGSFLHAGQVCMATERIIVHSSIVDSFIAAVKQSTNTMYGPTGPAPLFVTTNGARKTKGLVNCALSKAASVVLGDPKEPTEPDTDSCRIRPIILTNVGKGSGLYENESFGPAVAIYSRTD